MTAFYLYLIKSTFCLALFYLCYKVLLSNETFFGINRRVLLVGMLACMALPWVEIKTDSPGVFQQLLLQWEEEFTGYELGGEDEAAGWRLQPPTAGLATEEKPGVEWKIAVPLLYIAGMGVQLILLVVSLVSLFKLIRNGQKTEKAGYTLVVVNSNIHPLNWGRYILLSKQDYLDHFEEVVIHEQEHCRKRHSVDLMFAEAIILLHWFNPAAWLLKRELQDVHEFQADRKVLQQGIDATKYQLLLVKKAVGSSSYTLANSFNHSKIKKRITMMMKERSTNRARLKVALLVPVAACVLAAFARPEVNSRFEQLVEAEGEGTTFVSPAQSFTHDYFDREMKAYLKKSNLGEESLTATLPLLKERAHFINFFINFKGNVLFDNRPHQMNEMEGVLQKELNRKRTDKKPSLIYFVCDVTTDPELERQALEMIGQAFERFRATEEGKEAPVLVFCDNPKSYGVRKKSNPPTSGRIEVRVRSESNDTTVFYFEHSDNIEAVKLKFRQALTKNPQEVFIKAASDVPMGRITDIKEVLRQICTPDGEKRIHFSIGKEK